MGTVPTVVVLDDDPTGIQTVHGCILLTRWDPDAVAEGFGDETPLFYVLTNTRSETAGRARQVVSEIMTNVCAVSRELGRAFTAVSRSDSTLRSHFPVEVDTVVEHVERTDGKSVDAVLLVPAFFEAGRITDSDTHYILENGKRIKTSDTEFARDSVFGYADSHLPSYIEEKTGGRVAASAVRSIPCDLLEPGRTEQLAQLLRSLSDCTHVVVNATAYAHLDVFTEAVRAATAGGKRFVFQSAASLVKSLARVSDRPLLRDEIACPGGRGLIVFGSHVKKSTAQLEALMGHDAISGVEVNVSRIVAGDAALSAETDTRVAEAWENGRTPVVYTSRQELRFASSEQRLSAGQHISQFLVDIVKRTPSGLAWLMGKGGITSHDLLVEGLRVRTARVLGQVLPGVPVIRTAPDSLRPDIPYVIFPGNVGDDHAVLDAFRVLRGEKV